MSAVRLICALALGALVLAGCSGAPAPPAPVAAQPSPAPVLEPQTVTLDEQFEIIDEFGTVIATAAFTRLELDPECNPAYGGEPPETGHYMFIGMSVETTAAYFGEGSFTYPSAHDFDVVPADGPTEGDVYPMAGGGDLCLPDDKEAFGFSTWTANGEYEGWIVLETQHPAGELVFVPHFFTHTAGWSITYPTEPAPAVETSAAAEPAVAADPADYCDDPDWWNARQSGDPGDYVAACGQYPHWLEEPYGYDDGYQSDGLESACADGTASVEECFGPGSDQNGNGVADANEYCDGTNGPDCIPRAYSPGTEGGEEPTSGETQHQYGCEQGYIPPEEC